MKVTPKTSWKLRVVELLVVTVHYKPSYSSHVEWDSHGVLINTYTLYKCMPVLMAYSGDREICTLIPTMLTYQSSKSVTKAH